MIKSIHDVAVETLNKYRNQNYNSDNKGKVELANAINVILPNYVKQGKLLDLYKEYFRLNNLPLKAWDTFVFNRLLEIKNEIKELEK